MPTAEEARTEARWRAVFAEIKKLRELEDKLRKILMPNGRRKLHGANVSMLGSEYDELCELLEARK